MDAEFFWGMVSGSLLTGLVTLAGLGLFHDETSPVVVVPMVAEATVAIQQCDHLGDALNRQPEVLSNAEGTVYWCELK